MKIKFRVESLEIRGLLLAVGLFICTFAFAQSDFAVANAAYAEGR